MEDVNPNLSPGQFCPGSHNTVKPSDDRVRSYGATGTCPSCNKTVGGKQTWGGPETRRKNGGRPVVSGIVLARHKP